MSALLHDPHFWVHVAFFIGVGLLVYKVWPSLAAMLDNRASKIKVELEEARRLREEAQHTLALYHRKQRDALHEAQEIVARGRAESERLAKQAVADMEAALQRRQRLAVEKIAQAEAKAVTEVRHAAVDVAVSAARRVIAESLDQQGGARLIDRAIDDLGRRLG